MEPEVDLVTLAPGEWQETAAAAAELDLIHGGYYRVRPNSILVYCGPENAPKGWEFGFPDGSPEVPRAAVGEIEVIERSEEAVTVRLIVSNWAAMRELKQAYDRGEYREGHQRFVLDQEAALRGRPEDRAWLREQFQKLRGHAAGRLIEQD